MLERDETAFVNVKIQYLNAAQPRYNVSRLRRSFGYNVLLLRVQFVLGIENYRNGLEYNVHSVITYFFGGAEKCVVTRYGRILFGQRFDRHLSHAILCHREPGEFQCAGSNISK